MLHPLHSCLKEFSMAHINLTWIEKQRFLGVDSAGHSMVLSPPSDVGVKPSENMLIALAACSAHDVVEILHKQRSGLQRLAVEVDAEQADQPPWMFRSIRLRYRASAEKLRPEQFERAVDLALNKYCSVRASLHPDISVSFEVEIEGA
jgi:putative redox protein